MLMMAVAHQGADTQRDGTLEGIRARDFARLDEQGTTYLDYTGAALYPASVVRHDLERLTASVFGNPHSESTASRASTDALDEARALTLQLFDAEPADYEVIFTANASSAIRILAEAFPFGRRSRLVMTADNHNSVNGLRIAARRRGAQVEYVALDADLRSHDPVSLLSPAAGPSLFAFPAQSNFSGVRHPLTWVCEAQRRGYRVLLDAAAYAATSALSLTAVPADFVAISYYKLFGYPTGVGALLARRDATSILRRQFFGGGTVQFVSVQNDVALARPGAGAFEDGTPHFLAMPAVCDGLRWFQALGMPAIERHISGLTATLLERLTELGDRVVIYGPRSAHAHGGSIAFNLQHAGRVLPYEAIEAAARDRGLAIRGGCFCNPGAAERAFNHPAALVRACLDGEFVTSRFRNCLNGAPIGALRASVGIPTIDADLDRLIACVVSLTN
jgi:selenocysteine lyase/cysteine desulfurase